ncbi:MAG: DNA polymerase III subunit alpha [Acidobacteria bacterium]|nr:DNA polymerase III subunit alpha [Acidobacteriota bacterium]
MIAQSRRVVFAGKGAFDLGLRRLHKSLIEDLAALNALYRPGALDAGMVDEYVRRKNGQSRAKYVVPEMKEVLEETHGVIVYQEQVMQIAQRIAGFSLGEADLLRKAMGKKKKEMMEEQRDKFVKGAVANNFDAAKAEEIFNFIEPFARYGFNKSHSVAYALLAYQTAWLKAHHPRHFMAALMSSEMDKTDSVVKFINESSHMGIRVLPPDINESDHYFTVVGDDIRFGLAAVKGVGASAVDSILTARREYGRFQDLLAFCESVDLRACNKKVIESLIKSGSFDAFGETRKTLFERLERVTDQATRAKEEKEMGQESLFGGLPSAPAPESTVEMIASREEWSEEEKLQYEKETLGFYITGHPLNRFSSELEQFAEATTETLAQKIDMTVNIGGIINQLKKTKIKKGRNEGRLMARFTLDDQTGSVDVVVFADLFDKLQRWIEDGLPVLVTANVKDTGGTPAGRSASLASAEQQSSRMSDEYGGHPEGGEETSSAGTDDHIITPELAALEIVKLEGIRDSKVKQLCLRFSYGQMDDTRVQKLREILESYPGSVPIQVALTDLPDTLQQSIGNGGSVQLRINPHFMVQPGPQLADAVQGLAGELLYSY